ncbi:hypothetical protein FXF51_50495 [Nonomuraea sp. PA05]|uniref:hypothetical protein n=1 Tax=Nonomuraea sp. PA05 TaxID=2604466 RepID=UPI0011D5E382|nr:hypothetical protein [Nonomuraea sp. PA05]TYB53014.1 hypothetical protein FXF51_50495 [Nonomuraea sp. PA05]
MSLSRIAATALLVVSLNAAPARADGSHECFSGSRTWDGTYFELSASGCDGVGYSQVTVLIRFGPAQGAYSCASVFSWNGTLAGDRCGLL